MEMNTKRDQEELQTFGSNFGRRSLFSSKSLTAGGIEKMFVSVNKPQVPKREDWSHLVNSTEQKSGSPSPKKSPCSVEDTKQSVLRMKDDDEKSSTLEFKLEAMTWAAMAKDATILALQQKLRAALLSLQKERNVNAQLRIELEVIGKEVRQKQPSDTQSDGDWQSAQSASLHDKYQEPTILESNKLRNTSELQSPLDQDSQQA